MRRSTLVAVGILVSGSLIASMIGCGVGILPTDTLAQAAAKIPMLNQITVGDVVQGFQDFVTQMQAAHEARASLTTEQIAQVEDLQAQLDAGQITAEDFEAKVQGVLGDAAPALAFGGFRFFGGPFGHRMGNDFAARLNLTDEQKTQAREIFQTAHTDIRALRQAAHDQMIALLTPEQQATLDQIRAQGFLSFAIFGLQPAGSGTNNTAAQRPHRGPHGRFFERLSAALSLTDEQKAQIETIRTDLRTQVQARHAQAREAFLASLTDEQKATLEQLEARRHPDGRDLPLPPRADD